MRRTTPQAAPIAPFPEERGHSLGLALKVNKEEAVAMWVAPEHHLKRDHQKDWSEWEERVRVIASSLAAARGVNTERFVPEIANRVPHLRIRWDPGVVKISHANAVRQLREGEPSIEPVHGSYVEDTLEFAPWTLLRPKLSPEGSGRCGSE